MDSLLVYGAYGYTGELIARNAVSRGNTPVLAGRDAARLAALGDDLGCTRRTFDLRSPERIADALDDIDVVLNCAGPFRRTADPLVDACLAAGVDYLDITGELTVFERLARRDDETRNAGVTLLPGVGFDVVPTDCLAAHLHDRLPTATHLSIAIDAEGSLSRGTLKTLIDGLGTGGAVREHGSLRYQPTASRSRTVDFGSGRKRVVTAPLGDVSTAYWTTGIETIRAYVALPDGVDTAHRLSRLVSADRLLDSLGGSTTAKRLLSRGVDRLVSNPTAAERAANTTRIWGEAWSERTGETVQSVLFTPDPYELTASAAVACAERVRNGEAPTGYTTPASAFGSEFVLSFDGVERTDR